MKQNEYQTLNEDAIVRTVSALERRVMERFPNRGLAQTAAHLLVLSERSAREARSLGRPGWLPRLIALLTVIGGIGALYFLGRLLPPLQQNDLNLSELAQGLDAVFNILVISGLVVAFMIGLEARFKRRKALGGLYRLRALSHVIDMHQLTKDPASIVGNERTESSPARDLSHTQLLRYLDYCAEMLAMIGKLAALYAQHFPDATVISAVNDVETLTTNLSRKIWQKIVIVQGEPQD